MQLVKIIKGFFANNQNAVPAIDSVINIKRISSINSREPLAFHLAEPVASPLPPLPSPPPPTSPTGSGVPAVEHVLSDKFFLSIWCHLQRLPFVGILFALISVIFWSCMGLTFKMNTELHALQTLTFSSLMVSVVYLLIVLKCYTVKGDESKLGSSWLILLGIPGERIYLAARCLLGTLSLASFYSAYHYISMGDATTLRFTSPVFIAIFAKFLVGEPFGLVQGFNAILTVIGVVLIGRPKLVFKHFCPPAAPNASHSNEHLYEATDSPQLTDFLPMTGRAVEALDGNNNNSLIDLLFLSNNNITTTTTTDTIIGIVPHGATWLGLALALFSAVTISISMISMKKLNHTPVPVGVFWFSFTSVLFGAGSMLIFGLYRTPSPMAIVLIVAAAVCSCCDQLCIAMALRLENAGAVAVVQALCVVLSFVFSIVILSEPLYWTSALGGGLIFISVIIMGIAKMSPQTDYWHCLKSRLTNSNNKSFDVDSNYSMFSSNSIKSTRSVGLSLIELGLAEVPITPRHEPFLVRFAPLTPEAQQQQQQHNRRNSSYLTGLLANSACTLKSPKGCK